MSDNQINSILYAKYGWVKIKKIVLSFQQKIYKASRKCDIHQVHVLQSVLLHAKSTRLLATQIIIKQLEKQYWLCARKKSIISSVYKLMFLGQLLRKNELHKKNSIFFVISEKIKQYVVFLVLRPEWHNKLEFFLRMESGKVYSQEIKTRLSSFFTDYSSIRSYKNCSINFESITTAKYVDKKYLIHKLSTFTYIEDSIINWLNNQFFFESPYATKNIIMYGLNNSDYDQLWILIQRIIYSGMEWYLYTHLKLEQLHKKVIFFIKKNTFFLIWNRLFCSYLGFYIANFIKSIGLNTRYKDYTEIKFSINRITIVDESIIFKYIHRKHYIFSLELNDSCIKQLLQKIRFMLYHKNIANKWRTNKYSSREILCEIHKMLSKFYTYYLSILDNATINKINLEVDKLFYRWNTKQ